MKLSRRIVGTALVALAVFAGVSAASGDRRAASKPYNVLFIGGITGPFASSGDQLTSGVRIAIGYINAHGGVNGRQIKLKVLNSTGDPTTAVSVLQQYLSSGTRPDVVYSGFISAEALALLPVLTRSKIFTISQASSIALNNPNSYPYHFGGAPDSQTQLSSLKSQLPAGTKLLGILAPNNPTGQSEAGRVQAALKDSGINTTVRFFDQDAVDLTVPTQAVISQKPDAVFLSGTDAQAERLLAARLTVGYSDTPTFGGSGLSDRPPSQFAGKTALRNLKIIYDPGLLWKPKKQRCAAEQYLLKQGGFTSAHPRYNLVYVEALAYDMMRAVAIVAAKSKKTDPDSMKAAFESFKARPKDCFITQPARQYSAASHFPNQPYVFQNTATETFQDGLIRVG